MKNLINHFYNFNISDISYNSSKYYFKNNDIRYMLKIVNSNKVSLPFKNINFEIINEGYLFFFIIVPNKYGQYITYFDNKPYILLKLSNIVNSRINIFDIRTDLFIRSSHINNHFDKVTWQKLWENKIDYFEDLFSKRGNQFYKYYPLFNYFIGISENALQFLKEASAQKISENADDVVIQHRRINYFDSLYDYYDTSEVILDHASRDISEYIKSCFLNDMWDIQLFSDYLDCHYFSKYGLTIMYSRILFPTFFFDYIDNFLVDGNDKKIIDLENKIGEYQFFLYQIGNLFNVKYGIETIEWILKKT